MLGLWKSPKLTVEGRKSLQRRLDCYSGMSGSDINSSTAKLYERLQNRPQGPGGFDSADKIVLLALGAFERYYVCWKTEKEHYEQDSYGLPEELQRWLFPVDGSTRDFATLQVILGKNDEYFASDRMGKISSHEKSSDEDRPELRRSLSISSGSSKLTWSTSNSNLGQRQRSMSPAGNPYAPEQQLHGLHSSSDRFRSISPAAQRMIPPINTNIAPPNQQPEPSISVRGAASSFQPPNPPATRPTWVRESNQTPTTGAASSDMSSTRKMPRLFPGGGPNSKPSSRISSRTNNTLAEPQFGDGPGPISAPINLHGAPAACNFSGSTNTSEMPFRPGHMRILSASSMSESKQLSVQPVKDDEPSPPSPGRQKPRLQNTVYSPVTGMMTPEQSPERSQAREFSLKEDEVPMIPIYATTAVQTEEYKLQVKKIPQTGEKKMTYNPGYKLGYFDASTQMDEQNHPPIPVDLLRHQEIRSKIQFVQEHLMMGMAFERMVDFFRSPSYQVGSGLIFDSQPTHTSYQGDYHKAT